MGFIPITNNATIIEIKSTHNSNKTTSIYHYKSDGTRIELCRIIGDVYLVVV